MFWIDDYVCTWTYIPTHMYVYMHIHMRWHIYHNHVQVMSWEDAENVHYMSNWSMPICMDLLQSLACSRHPTKTSFMPEGGIRWRPPHVCLTMSRFPDILQTSYKRSHDRFCIGFFAVPCTCEKPNENPPKTSFILEGEVRITSSTRLLDVTFWWRVTNVLKAPSC